MPWLKRLLNPDRIANATSTIVAIRWPMVRRALYSALAAGFLWFLWEVKVADFLDARSSRQGEVLITLIEPFDDRFKEHWGPFEKSFRSVIKDYKDKLADRLDIDDLRFEFDTLIPETGKEYQNDLNPDSVLVIGPVTSSGAKKFVGISRQKRLPHLLFSATAEGLTRGGDQEDPYVFRAVAKNSRQAESLANQLRVLRENCKPPKGNEEETSCDRVGIVRPPQNPIYHESIARDVTTALEKCKKCPKVIMDVVWSPDGSSARALKELAPRFVLLTGVEPDFTFFERQLKALVADKELLRSYLLTDGGVFSNKEPEGFEEDTIGVFLHRSAQPDLAPLGRDAARLVLMALHEIPDHPRKRRPWSGRLKCVFVGCSQVMAEEMHERLKRFDKTDKVFAEEFGRDFLDGETVELSVDGFKFDHSGENELAKFHPWVVVGEGCKKEAASDAAGAADAADAECAWHPQPPQSDDA